MKLIFSVFSASDFVFLVMMVVVLRCFFCSLVYLVTDLFLFGTVVVVLVILVIFLVVEVVLIVVVVLMVVETGVLVVVLILTLALPRPSVLLATRRLTSC